MMNQLTMLSLINSIVPPEYNYSEMSQKIWQKPYKFVKKLIQVLISMTLEYHLDAYAVRDGRLAGCRFLQPDERLRNRRFTAPGFTYDTENLPRAKR